MNWVPKPTGSGLWWFKTSPLDAPTIVLFDSHDIRYIGDQGVHDIVSILKDHPNSLWLRAAPPTEQVSGQLYVIHWTAEVNKCFYSDVLGVVDSKADAEMVCLGAIRELMTVRFPTHGEWQLRSDESRDPSQPRYYTATSWDDQITVRAKPI